MSKKVVGIAIIIVVIIGLVLFFVNDGFSKIDKIESIFVLVLVVGIGMVTVYRHFLSTARGEPEEDEYSKLILEKAASKSYYVSLYLWLIISYFSQRIKIDTEQVIGFGIIGMAVLFVIFWSYFRIKGLKSE